MDTRVQSAGRCVTYRKPNSCLDCAHVDPADLLSNQPKASTRKLSAHSHLCLMECSTLWLADFASVLLCVLASFFCGALSVAAQNVQHLTITQPGGMPSRPVIMGIFRGSNSVTVTWDGPSGYYQLFQNL